MAHPLLTIISVGASPTVDDARIELLSVANAPALWAVDVSGRFVVAVGDNEDVSTDGLLRLVAALDGTGRQMARGGYVLLEPGTGEPVYVPAPTSKDLLLELLLGSPFAAPLASFLFSRDAWLEARQGEWGDADWTWAAREFLAGAAMRWNDCLSIDATVARVGTALPIAPRDNARQGRAMCARLQAQAAGSPHVTDVHRRFLAQDWGLWRLGTARVDAGARTLATGAVGTMAGHTLAGVRDLDTLEGLSNRIRIRVPRLELTPLRLRDAVEGLAEDGLVVREAER